MAQKKKWSDKQPKERLFTIVTRGLLIVVGLVLLGSVVGALQSNSAPASNTTNTATSANKTQPPKTPAITHKTDVQTSSIPFESTTQYDSTKASGTSTITTIGVNGVQTKTYDVTLTDGIETSRSIVSDVTTTTPITQVTTVGTYVAPSCSNGSYVNSAGNTVCNPEYASSAPSGASAQCRDGTYSYSQSRSGTCSHHGGVATWL
jgi:resuscitation-promoting factor RpfB